jgi:ring-1,2-phenylacetyl-CoA epoxidase subunit PaaD
VTVLAKAKAERLDEAAVRDLVRRVADQVVDPQTGLTAAELGFLRDVSVENGKAVIDVMPTHPGCPSMGLLTMNLECAIEDVFALPRVRTLFSPSWTPAMMTDEGRAKLRKLAERRKGAFVCGACGRPLDFMCG